MNSVWVFTGRYCKLKYQVAHLFYKREREREREGERGREGERES